MDRGYFKIWRKLKDNPISQDPKCLALFIHLLFEAEWQEGRKKVFNGQEVTLKAGQLTCGRKQLSQWSGLSERSVRTCITKLRNLKITTSQTTNRMSLITILNWDTYNCSNNQNDQLNDLVPTSKRPANDHTLRIKNLRSKEKDSFDFIPELKKLYEPMGISVETELVKMRGWLLIHPNRKMTKKFAVNWINKNLKNNEEVIIGEPSGPRPFPKDS